MSKFFRSILFIVGTILVLDYLLISHVLGVNFGAVVPLLIGIIFLIHAIFWDVIKKYITANTILLLTWKICWGIFSLWLISFVMFITYLKLEINSAKQATDIDAIIILGAGVNGTKPSITLAQRLDAAAIVSKDYPNAKLVTSGGVGIGKSHSEADVMENYLINNHKIDTQKIFKEERSTSTETNLIFSSNILAKQNIDISKNRIALVTSDFHTIRAKAIAKKQGYNNVVTVPSHTPILTRANAWFREYFACIGGWILKEY